MAEFHEGDSPDATGMASEPDFPVVAESFTYAEVDGAALNGYMAFANPSGQSYDIDDAADAWAKTLRLLEANLKG